MNFNPLLEAAGAAGGDVVGIFPAAASFSENPSRAIRPVVHNRESHNISRRDIDPDALKVLYRLARNNYTAYLVGGGVRDLLLGRKPKDFDVSTNAKPEQIRALFRNCILIGRRFRLAHIRYGERIIETSTFRRSPDIAADPADPEADLFQRDDNLFGSPEEDAMRRDFTVNGLFYDIESFGIIDYVGGIEDLALRRIRCIGNPCIRFREDPVRMIRAVRFASRLDFTLDVDTLGAIRKYGEELMKAAPARLLEEIYRLFAFSSGEKAMRLLHSTGLLAVILPEVASTLDNPAIDHELFWRRLRALDDGDTVLPDATPALIFSTLLIEPLKAFIGRDWHSEGFPRLKFERVHAFLGPLSQRLRFPRKLVDRIVHMYLAQNRFANTGGKRGSIANFVTQDSFHESLALAELMLTAESRPQSGLHKWRDMLAERIYGKEEGTPDRHHDDEHVHRLAENDKPAETDIVLEEPPHGKKLSRSARRRRNKKLKRLQRMPEQAPAAHPQHPASSPVNESSQSVETEAPEVREPAEIESRPESAAYASPEKARAWRGKGKKREERGENGDGGAERPVQAADTHDMGEPIKPLTAAAFYRVPDPEVESKPEQKKKSVKKKSPAKKTVKSKKTEKQADAGMADSPERERLQMDKADEADIPMHWLDEI